MEKKKSRLNSTNPNSVMMMEFDWPEDIIQHIQSFMNAKQAVGTCLLSKSWYQAWSTRPILAFDVQLQRDLESIRACMERYKETNDNLQKLYVRVDGIQWHRTSTYSRIDELIKDASELGVKEIQLADFNDHVPPRVFTITSLTKLSFCNCSIKKLPPLDSTILRRLVSLGLHRDLGKNDNRIIQDILLRCPSIENLDLEDVECVPSINLGELQNLVSLRVHDLNGRDRTNVSFESITNGGQVNSVPEFHKLRSVCLKRVRIEGGFFTDFSSRFPCIEDLSLKHCGGYEENIQISSKSLKYLNLVIELKKAEFDVEFMWRKMEIVSINLGELHNLVSLRVVYMFHGRPKVSFESITSGGLVNSVPQFHKLRSVSLEWATIEGGFFTDFSSRFPCIEDLSLKHCGGYEENIQISSKSLRYLNLEPGPERLEKAEFDVPNIRKFGLKSHHLPALSLSTVSMEWESKLEFSVYSGPVGASWFVRLGGFLKRLSKSRISLHLNINPGMDVSGHHLPCSPTTLVENLTVNNYSLQAQTFLAALIVYFRPTCITLISPHSHMSYSDTIEFVEHTDQKLFANQKNATICSSMMESLITYPFKKIEYETSQGEWRTIEMEKIVGMGRFRVKWGASNVT